MERLAVERERLERPARDVHDRAAGCLVHAPRLHSDEPVLDEVDAPDSVLAAQPVEPGEERDGVEPLAVHRHRVAPLEVDLDGHGRVGRRFRILGELEHLRRRLGPRVLEHAALVGDVEEVPVGAVRALRRHRHRDVVALRELDQRASRGELPLAPRRDHAEVGCQGGVGQLEADLVVPLPCRTVGDRVRPLRRGDLQLGLGDERARDGGPEEIGALVHGVGAQHREDEVADEPLA